MLVHLDFNLKKFIIDENLLEYLYKYLYLNDSLKNIG